MDSPSYWAKSLKEGVKKLGDGLMTMEYMVYFYDLLLCLNSIRAPNFTCTFILQYDVTKPALTIYKKSISLRLLHYTTIMHVYCSFINE